jgi:hypothetical protein
MKVCLELEDFGGLVDACITVDTFRNRLYDYDEKGGFVFSRNEPDL